MPRKKFNKKLKRYIRAFNHTIEKEIAEEEKKEENQKWNHILKNMYN